MTYPYGELCFVPIYGECLYFEVHTWSVVRERKGKKNDDEDTWSASRNVCLCVCTRMFMYVSKTYGRWLLWIKSVVCEPQEETVGGNKDNREMSRTMGFCQYSKGSVNICLCQWQEELRIKKKRLFDVDHEWGWEVSHLAANKNSCEKFNNCI